MNRRSVLKGALLGVAANASSGAVGSLPEPSLLQRDPERYWKRIRAEQFLLPEWRIFLNNGSLGPAPKPVVAATSEYLSFGAGLTSDEYPRWGYETLDSQRTELAAFLGCKKDEL